MNNKKQHFHFEDIKFIDPWNDMDCFEQFPTPNWNYLTDQDFDEMFDLNIQLKRIEEERKQKQKEKEKEERSKNKTYITPLYSTFFQSLGEKLKRLDEQQEQKDVINQMNQQNQMHEENNCLEEIDLDKESSEEQISTVPNFQHISNENHSERNDNEEDKILFHEPSDISFCIQKHSDDFRHDNNQFHDEQIDEEKYSSTTTMTTPMIQNSIKQSSFLEYCQLQPNCRCEEFDNFFQSVYCGKTNQNGEGEEMETESYEGIPY